jgi:hypothetical protein
MCRRVTCKQCGKPSWAGCGAHVDSVLADVPRSERCRCGEKSASVPASGFKVTPKASAAPTAAQGRLRAWLSK